MMKTKQLLGDEHPNTLTSMANLAATYRSQGHWVRAEEIDISMRDIQKQKVPHVD